MYKPTCPYCRAKNVVRFGHPRWKCNRCKRTFRLKRKDTRDRAAIAGYVLDRSTYRRLGDRWKVDHTTAMRRVRRALMKRRSLLDRTKRLLHSSDGIVLLDGKHVSIKGKKHTLFVAWDRGLGLPIHFRLQEEGEKELWYWKMMLELKYIGYIPKGFVSDGIATLKEYLSQACPDLPHQRCTVHVFLAIRGKLKGNGKKDERAQDLIELVKHILWSKSLPVAEERLLRLQQTTHLKPKERNVLDLLAQTLPECFVCRDPKWRHLKLPRSSNAIENVMGQAEARLKTRRGTKSLASARLLVNELLLQVRRQVINQ